MNRKDFKVIFVGSASYSGSTMLDLMLSNSDNSFSCGEVVALFRPWRKHHFPNNFYWDNLLKGGEENLYENIVKHNSSINLIVDSSKDPFWIKKQQENLSNKGIPSLNILIWKSPSEIYASFKKRNREQNWLRSWCNYHLLYFSLIDSYTSLNYKSLVDNTSDEIANILGKLHVSYELGQENFWQKQENQNILFGNTNTTYHLSDKNDEVYLGKSKRQESQGISNKATMDKNYRTIYYNKVPQLPKGLASKHVIIITKYLAKLSNGSVPRYTKLHLKARKLYYNFSKLSSRIFLKINV